MFNERAESKKKMIEDSKYLETINNEIQRRNV
jgi:hypothetical protein